MLMERNEEIVSLNAVRFEQKEDMTLDERLERLTSEELKGMSAGSNSCSTKCAVDCSGNCSRDCPNNCDTNCEWHDCPYNDPGGWICPCDGFVDYCDVMNGWT